MVLVSMESSCKDTPRYGNRINVFALTFVIFDLDLEKEHLTSELAVL